MGLNPKQMLFVKEYLVDKNATRAAKAAGYSEKTAGKIGSENLSKPDIAAAIEQGLKEQAQIVDQKAAARGVTLDRWLQELEHIAFARMDDFAIVQPNQTLSVLSSDKRKPGCDNAIKKITYTQTQFGGSISLDLHNKLPALELIAKHHGWIKDQVENLNPNPPQVIITLPSNGREKKKT